MSNDENKYGKKELELLAQVLKVYQEVGKTFVHVTNGNLAIMSDNQKKVNSNIYLLANKESLHYMTFALDKILKDNFDEDFIKEKMKS